MPSGGRTPSCDRCAARAVWEAVTNGDHRDVFACGRHLHTLLLDVTGDGWAKVDQIAPARVLPATDGAT